MSGDGKLGAIVTQTQRGMSVSEPRKCDKAALVVLRHAACRSAKKTVVSN